MGKAAQSLKDIKSSRVPVSVWCPQNRAIGVKKILAMKGNQSDYRCLDPNSGFWRCQVFLWLQKSASPNQILIGGTDLTCANPFSSEFWVMYGMKSSIQDAFHPNSPWKADVLVEDHVRALVSLWPTLLPSLGLHEASPLTVCSEGTGKGWPELPTQAPLPTWEFEDISNVTTVLQ